jgi:hypothetical protein
MITATFPRRLALGMLALTLALAPAHAWAQEGQGGRPRRGWMRPAKWLALGAAGGLAAYALTRTGRADDAYTALRRACAGGPAGCALDGGVYVDPEAERLYQRALAEDRRAQTAIIGGQTVLLGAAALFVLDLRDRDPADIPYPSPSRSCAAARCFLVARLTF